jgi:protein-S-isoprenylcysteine O-methyltransferase Ste14
VIHWIWLVLYCVWCGSEVLVAIVTRTRRSSGGVRDRGSLPLLWVTIFCSIWVGSWWGAVHVRTILGGADWVRTAAVAVMTAGLAIRWTAILSLGRAFSVNVAIHSDQRLYRSGLYALVRHPSYTGLVVIFVALGMRTANWTAMAILVLPAAAALLYRMNVEEAALRSAFADYADYARTTKRLVPGIY